MKIERSNEKKSVTFGDLAKGDTFTYDCNTYLKTDLVGSGTMKVNCVCFDYANLSYLASDDKVEVVQAKLTVE